MQPRLSHKQKKYYSMVMVYSVLLILLLIFFFTIGFKILVNVSLFIANKSDTAVTSSQDDTYLLAPQINNIPDATNSATIKVSGTAEHTAVLTAFMDNAKVKEIPIDGDNSFETELSVKKGTNEIYFKLENKKSKIIKETKKFRVVYLDEKPTLEITSPHDGDTLHKNELTITGNTNPGVSLTINGAPVVVDSQGSFNYYMRLSEGDNHIAAVVTDLADNTETKEITIHYSPE